MDIVDFAAQVIFISASGVLSPGPLFFANLIYGSKLGTRTWMYIVDIWYIKYIAFYSVCSDKEINIYYVHTTYIIMVRRMIATITKIESVVTPSGNSGHVVVPKSWIGKAAIAH